MAKMKYVVVTGGVVSGLGKGITISSLGLLLKQHGLRVTSIKIDPYLNTDAGTMSPFEHGEVYVLDDGGEVDLDLGNYERFLGLTLTRDHNITTGKVYKTVIERERRGDYLGKTVQIIPHCTNLIQDWIERVAHHVDPASGVDGEPADVCLIELGGTVGDIESMVFLEALRQFQFRAGPENMCFVHVSLVPVVGAVGEQKTKPTQHSVKALRSAGLSPDMIVCRSTNPLEKSTRQKISQHCHCPYDAVLAVHDVSNIYHVPLVLRNQGCDREVMRRLGIESRKADGAADLKSWTEMAHGIDAMTETVRIALVGKYTGLSDSYLSVYKALKHAAIAVGRTLVVDWVDASLLEPVVPRTASATPDRPRRGSLAKEASNGASGEASQRMPSQNADAEARKAHDDAWARLEAADGILVPGGFGSRGVEGKILAANFARENNIPYFGICLGFQCMVIEFCRNVVGLTGANSTEFDEKAKHPAVVFMPEISTERMGGTMRLGSRRTVLQPSKDPNAPPSLAAMLYGDVKGVMERHRHRYEVNPELVDQIEAKGLRFTGKDDRGERMEIAELPRSEHPFFFGCQYHPEFKTQPQKPSPPFLGLILASIGQLSSHLDELAQPQQ